MTIVNMVGGSGSRDIEIKSIRKYDTYYTNPTYSSVSSGYYKPYWRINTTAGGTLVQIDDKNYAGANFYYTISSSNSGQALLYKYQITSDTSVTFNQTNIPAKVGDKIKVLWTIDSNTYLETDTEKLSDYIIEYTVTQVNTYESGSTIRAITDQPVYILCTAGVSSGKRATVQMLSYTSI